MKCGLRERMPSSEASAGSRFLVLLPGAVHRIRQNEVPDTELGKRRRIDASRLAHVRKVQNVVADPRDDRQRGHAGDRGAVLNALESRILVALTRRLTE